MARNKRQKYEAEQRAFRARYPQLQDPPVASTMRKWRQRAYARGVTPADFQSAMHSTGEFAEIKKQITDMERAHRQWKAAGGHWHYRDDNPPSAPDEWGETWSFYH